MPKFTTWYDKKAFIEDLTLDELQYLKVALIQRTKHYSINTKDEERSFIELMINEINTAQLTIAKL